MVSYTDNDIERLEALNYDVSSEGSWTEPQIVDLQTSAEQVVDQFDDDWEEIIYEGKKDWGEVLANEFKTTVAKAKLFFEIVDDYLSARYRLDGEWGVVDCEGLDSLDFYGDEIALQWTESGRCGDYDYLHRDFPVEHLWTSDWKAAIAETVAKRTAEREVKRLADLERLRKQTEERERKQLRELMAKYPDELSV